MKSSRHVKVSEKNLLAFNLGDDSFRTFSSIEPIPTFHGVEVARGYSSLQQPINRRFIFVSDKPSEISPPRKPIPEQQEICKTAIRALLETAGKHNWDGEGADPVTENTVAVAQGIVEELPDYVGVPEISADPEGCVEFDWHLDNGTMFTISIGQTGDIAVSGLYNGEAKLTGMQWDRRGKIDLLLQCGLEWLREMQENDNRK